MKISGSNTLAASPEQVWAAIMDPAVLARCIPGCESLTPTMKARGAGAPGTIDATVAVRLAPSPSGGTDLHYDADAAVGGAVGGVGQRMLAGVTKKMAGQFFGDRSRHSC